MAETERLVLLGGMIAVILLMMHALLRPQRMMSVVPPVVTPLQNPLEEELRALRHWRANVDQSLHSVATFAEKTSALAEKVAQQEQQLFAVRSDLGEIKGGLARSERMLNLLIENGLKEPS